MASNAQQTGVADYLPYLTGYFVVWGATSGDRGGYAARVVKGGTVQYGYAGRPLEARWAHDPNQILGTTANGTLKVEADDYGLKATIGPLPHTSTARDVAAYVRGGFVKGMSFGMVATDWQTKRENGQTVREFRDFAVPEVSVIGRPAFVETSINAVDPSPASPSATPARDAQSLRLAGIRLAAAAG